MTPRRRGRLAAFSIFFAAAALLGGACTSSPTQKNVGYDAGSAHREAGYDGDYGGSGDDASGGGATDAPPDDGVEAAMSCSANDSECNSGNYLAACTGGTCVAPSCCCPSAQQCRAGSFPFCCPTGQTCVDVATGKCQ